MRSIELSDNNTLLCFDWDFIDSHMYVLQKGRYVFVVDPADTGEVRRFFSDNRFEQAVVFLTHEHIDHISGVNMLRELCPATVYCNTVCYERIRLPDKNMSDKTDAVIAFNSGIKGRNIRIEPYSCFADVCFDDSIELDWHGMTVEAFTTPGHTTGSICILLDGKYLFSGDTLLGIPTITRLPSGSRQDFRRKTVPLLRSLVGKAELVFPGHGEYGRLEAFLKPYE